MAPASAKAAGSSLTEEQGGRFDPLAIDHMRDLEARFNGYSGGWPTDTWWSTQGSWHLAVDAKGEATCWESWKGMFDSMRQ